MPALLLALWPLFALIVGGHLLHRRDRLGEGFWPGAERLNYFILFPALLFHSLAGAPLDNPVLPRLAAAALLGLALAWTALLLGRRLPHASAPSPRACCASTPISAWRRSAACSVRRGWLWRH